MVTTMSSLDFDSVLQRAKGKLKRLEAAEMYLDYLQNTFVVDHDTIPHCDMRVLHSPGTCAHCDDAAPLQQYRKMLGLEFTDELQEDDPLLPGERRTKASADRWGGNQGAKE